MKLAEKFKYRGVTLTSDGKQDEKLDAELARLV